MGIPEWLGLEMRFNETIKAGGGSFPHSEDRPTPEGYQMLKKYLEHEYKFLEVLENEMGDKSACNQQPPSPPHPPTPPAVPVFKPLTLNTTSYRRFIPSPMRWLQRVI